MIVGSINSTYFINSLDNYSEIKEELLNRIKNTKDNMMSDERNKIFSTDWNLPKDIDRPYVNFFVDIIKPYISKITEYLMYEKTELSNFWFQRYQNQNEHPWHSHPNFHFANVFYVELPDESLKTEILDPITKNIVDDIKVKEGDLLTFPAHLLHRSPLNTTDNIKTIISFNTNMNGANLKQINNIINQ